MPNSLAITIKLVGTITRYKLPRTYKNKLAFTIDFNIITLTIIN